jgi:hypothetical protein
MRGVILGVMRGVMRGGMRGVMREFMWGVMRHFTRGVRYAGCYAGHYFVDFRRFFYILSLHILPLALGNLL